jgi:hypothetical protein
LRVVLTVAEGVRAFLASEEITSPKLFCSAAARSLAAARMSSSMERVVRITHQESYIKIRILLSLDWANGTEPDMQESAGAR